MPFESLVYQVTTSEGAGNLIVPSSTADGWRTLAGAHGTGASSLFAYAIRHPTAVEWETGIGYMSDTTTLVRATVLRSSNANAAVSFSAGSKEISATAIADTFGGIQPGHKLAEAHVSTTVVAGTPSEILINPVPSTYRHLRVMIQGRVLHASESRPIYCQCNGDTGANYEGTVNGVDGPTTGMYLGELTSATTAANHASTIDTIFHNYRDTTWWKRYASLNSWRISASSYGVAGGGSWKSTTAITSLRIYPDVGTLVAGTVVHVYGMN